MPDTAFLDADRLETVVTADSETRTHIIDQMRIEVIVTEPPAATPATFVAICINT